MRLFSIQKIFNILILILMAACATPTSPTGGPPDEENPRIVATEPETGTTNFDGRSIIFHFSEFINRSSVNDAITIEPDVGLTYSWKWGRKSLRVNFESDLPDSTTLIVTIGTDLRDLSGNKLASPYKVAVSTGPEIDKGEIVGRVVDAQTGEGTEGNRILLYREPVDLTQRASYSAETDTGGTFRFSYLGQGDYKPFWIDDRNRNRVWERERERAQPFLREFVSLKKGGADTLQTLFIAQSDTSEPEFQGVGLFSSQRLRMRFSEEIELLDSTTVTVNDSLGNAYSDAYPLYVSTADPYVLFANSEKPLTPEDSFQVIVNNISDNFGNISLSSARKTTGSAQGDTTAQRIIGRTNEAGLFPTEAIEIIYAKPILEPDIIIDSTQIVAGSKMVEDPDGYMRVGRNRVFVAPPDQWKPGLEYEVRIWDPAQNRRRNITPNIWYENDLGELDIQLDDTTSATSYRLIIKSGERDVMTDTTFSKGITVAELPPLSYQVIAYEDLNGNKKWDRGQVDPYRAPEPYFIQNNVPVKANFTSGLTISFSNQKPK